MVEIIYVWLGVIGLSEVYISVTRRSKTKSRKRARDQSTLWLIWIAAVTGATLACVIFEVNRPSVHWLPWVIGLMLSISGSILRWLAISQLKEEFTVDVSIKEAHQLKKGGLYRRIRHPSYTGLLLSFVGLGLAMNDLIPFLLISLPLLASIVRRIYIEERILLDEFGTEYQDYQQQTDRLIPFIY